MRGKTRQGVDGEVGESKEGRKKAIDLFFIFFDLEIFSRPGQHEGQIVRRCKGRGLSVCLLKTIGTSIVFFHRPGSN